MDELFDVPSNSSSNLNLYKRVEILRVSPFLLCKSSIKGLSNAFPDSKTVNKLSVPLNLVFNLILFSYVKCKDSLEVDSDSAPNVKNKLPLTFVVGKYFFYNLSFAYIFSSTFFDDP